MNEIWANRLVAGTKTWDEVPAMRKEAVRAVLIDRIERGVLMLEQYKAITGETLNMEAMEK